MTEEQKQAIQNIGAALRHLQTTADIHDSLQLDLKKIADGLEPKDKTE